MDDKIRHTIEAKKRCECYCIPKDEMRAAFASLPDVWFMMKHKAISEAIAFEQSLDDIDDERISELHNLLDEVSGGSTAVLLGASTMCMRAVLA